MTEPLLRYEQALSKVLATAAVAGSELVPLRESYGRVLATSLKADRDYPPFNRAMMDGFALSSADFATGQRLFPIAGQQHAGDALSVPLPSGQAIQIMTGAPVPAGADAVVRIEDCVLQGEAVQIAVERVSAGLAVARQGEDCLRGQELLAAGQRIGPTLAATIATLGYAEVPVFKLPVLHLLSTGTEIVPPGQEVALQQIRDSNSYALEAFWHGYQVPVAEKQLVADNPDQLHQAIVGATKADVLVVSGGVSMGVADYVPGVLQEAGFELHFHKLRIKPGKPLWFGRHREGTLVFALPGNPISSQVGFKLFVEPWLRAHWAMAPLAWLPYPLGQPFVKKTPYDQWVPASLVEEDGLVTLHLQPMKSSGDILTTALAQGLAHIPAGQMQVEAGQSLVFSPW